jgi:hypothetical protein
MRCRARNALLMDGRLPPRRETPTAGFMVRETGREREPANSVSCRVRRPEWVIVLRNPPSPRSGTAVTIDADVLRWSPPPHTSAVPGRGRPQGPWSGKPSAVGPHRTEVISREPCCLTWRPIGGSRYWPGSRPCDRPNGDQEQAAEEPRRGHRRRARHAGGHRSGGRGQCPEPVQFRSRRQGRPHRKQRRAGGRWLPAARSGEPSPIFVENWWN